MKSRLVEIPAAVVAVTDYEPLAAERMTPDAWAYVSGGAADEITLRANKEAFDRVHLHGRVLADLSQGSTRSTLLGQVLEHPLLLAPVAYQRLMHEEGERATARAASAMDAGMVLSAQSSVLIEDVAAETSSPLWFQLYVLPDRGFTLELAKRAEAAGCAALVVTVDAPVSGARHRESRAGFRLPAGVSAVNLEGAQSWALPKARPGGSPLFGSGLLESAPTWGDLTWLRGHVSIPIVLKGITSPDDAVHAADEGIDAVVVSNHGGRTLDTLPSSLEALAAIAGRVGNRLPLLVDGGIRRGTDVLKALAFGASAVLIGRPYVWGLAAAGSTGVAHVLSMLRAELEIAMALTGCRKLDDISTAVMWRE